MRFQIVYIRAFGTYVVALSFLFFGCSKLAHCNGLIDCKQCIGLHHSETVCVRIHVEMELHSELFLKQSDAPLLASSRFCGCRMEIERTFIE